MIVLLDGRTQTVCGHNNPSGEDRHHDFKYCFLFFYLLGSAVPVNKFARKSTQDEDLGVKYNFVQDGHTFTTEGATLK